MRQYFFCSVISSLLTVGVSLTALGADASELRESLIAHQYINPENIRATVHLEPDDSPYTGVPSFT